MYISYDNHRIYVNNQPHTIKCQPQKYRSRLGLASSIPRRYEQYHKERNAAGHSQESLAEWGRSLVQEVREESHPFPI